MSGRRQDPDWVDWRWRVGRKVGRTIYAVVGKEPSDEDVLIGVMDTPALALEAVTWHNVSMAAAERRAHEQAGR